VSAKISIVIVCLAISLRADPPAGYYQNATNKTGFALRAALHEIINDHTVIPYFHGFFFDTSDALRTLDQDPQNPANVFLIYAQRSEPTNTFGLAAGWNREHLWPNSYGLDDVEPAYSDLFNLRAEDATVNSDRGNLYFDTSDTNTTAYRFPAHTEATQCSKDADSWEPPANARGDIARSLFYMDVRYEGDRTNELQLRLTDAASKINNTNSIMGKLSTLLRWHEADPVDAPERRRNDLIYERYQHNRNPFIDHPEWVNAVFRPTLSITRSGTNVVLTWDTGWTNFSIQASANLRTWSAVSTNRLPATNAFRFFRLTVPVD
jgi:endonuclease I